MLNVGITSVFTMFFVALILLLVVLSVTLFRQRKDHFKFFIKRGLSGPEPSFFFGNIVPLQTAKDAAKTVENWYHDYAINGNFGFFYGTNPVLVSTDLHLAQRVLIKEFAHFCNRGDIHRLEVLHPMTQQMLIWQQSTKWRQTRGYISSSFSTVKLKACAPAIIKGCEDLISVLKNEKGEFDIVPILCRVTLDNISRTAFGFESCTVRSEDEAPKILKLAKKTTENIHRGPLTKIIQSFDAGRGALENILLVLYKIGIIKHGFEHIRDELREVVEYRRMHSQNRNDFIESLLKAEAFSGTTLNELTAHEDDEEQKEIRPLKPSVGTRMPAMDTEGVVGNTIIFFAAGFDTTSNGLQALVLRLAENVDIQEKLRAHIQSVLEETKDTINYDSIAKMPYLAQVVNESLRMDPPVTMFTTREALEPFEYKGFVYPKGTSIMFPCNIIQRNPDYFPDPERFDPERFSPERKNEMHPMAFMSFGKGPRNCIGMRFALMQMKLITCYILIHFRISLAKNFETDFVTRSVFLRNPEKVCIRLEQV